MFASPRISGIHLQIYSEDLCGTPSLHKTHLIDPRPQMRIVALRATRSHRLIEWTLAASACTVWGDAYPATGAVGVLVSFQDHEHLWSWMLPVDDAGVVAAEYEMLEPDLTILQVLWTDYYSFAQMRGCGWEITRENMEAFFEETNRSDQ